MQIKLGLKVHYPQSVGILVYDPTKPHTHYLRRRVPFDTSQFKGNGKAHREIQISLPITPKLLVLEVHNKHTYDEKGIQIENLRLEKVPPSAIWASPERHRFMDFAIQFAKKAGYSPTGFYDSKDSEFLIQYLPTIRDHTGNELVTPARIHQQMPRVQLSKQLFQGFSIPVRVAILAHEACHFFKDTRSERQADLCGIKYYLDYGFPIIEAVYAATKVFGLHPESVSKPHVKRTAEIIDFIDSYKAQRKLQNEWK